MSKKKYLKPSFEFSFYELDVLTSSGDSTTQEDFFDNPTPWIK